MIPPSPPPAQAEQRIRHAERAGIPAAPPPPEPICDELLFLATPTIYATNAFRVLGMHITAGASDIRRQQTRAEMQRKLGLGGHPGECGVLPPKQPPDEHLTALSLERICDPVSRFLEEFFWFWPTDEFSAHDAALAALARGDVAAAAEEWTRLTGYSGAAPSALHNLAVLHHLTAIEADKPSPAVWRKVFEHWKTVAASETIWEKARERVRQINDARLTTGFVRRMSATLPKALLLISARLAVQAAEKGDSKTAACHAEIVRDSSLGEGLADTVFRDALKPVRDRIEAAVSTARNRWKREAQHGHTIVRELHKETLPVLPLVNIVLPSDSPVRKGIHDALADAMLEGQIAFGIATNDWAESERLLALAATVAVGQAMRDRIEENKKAVRENMEFGNCWCAPGYWNQAPAVVADLESARNRANAGDFDGALELLLVMDPAIGKPLRRCVSYCLGLSAIRAHNAALGDFNAGGKTMQKVVDRSLKNGLGLYSFLNRPTPETPMYSLPPCPGCGGRYYSSWLNFSYQNLSLWMCETCSYQHDSEVASLKITLAAECKKAADRIKLADEIDPRDPGIRRNLDVIKGMLKELNGGSPDSSSVKARLAVARSRRILDAERADAAGGLCFFCSTANGSGEGAIRVPMHGPVSEVKLLLGPGKEYHAVECVVPRCAACRREHENLPSRIEAWHEAALKTAENADLDPFLKEVEASSLAVRSAAEKLDAAGDDSSFPDLTAAIARAATVREETSRREDRTKAELRLAEAALKDAQAAVGFFTKWFGGATPAVDSARSHLGKAQTNQEKAGHEHKLAERAYKEAQTELESARHQAQEDASNALEERKRSLDIAFLRWKDALDGTVADYKQRHPMPTLPPGIRPERDFRQSRDLAGLTAAGWRFGDIAQSSDSPSIATGLLGREPVLRDVSTAKGESLQKTAERKTVQVEAKGGYQCPFCGKTLRRGGTKAHIKAKHPGATSADIKFPDAQVECPVCGDMVPASQFHKHMGDFHKHKTNSNLWASAPSSTGKKNRPSAPPAKSGEGGTMGVCPYGHGALKLWEGKPRCWTCGWTRD